MSKKSALPKVKILTIPDRESLEEFLREAEKEAKRVWRSTHPTSKRGAPSFQEKVWGACDAILLENGSSNKPLRKKNAYPFISVADWDEAIKQRLDTTTVKDPYKTIRKHFRTWLLNLDERVAELPLCLLFYFFQINPDFHRLKTLESCRAFRNGTSYPQSISETVKLISSAIVKLRPLFTLKELYEFGCADFSLQKINSMVEAGNSREEILKTVQAEDPQKFKVVIGGFRPPRPGHKNIGLRIERSPKH